MNKRLLMVGVSSLSAHAGQYKLYFLADVLATRGVPVSVIVPDIAENRAFLAERPHIEAHFIPIGSALQERCWKNEAVRRGNWSAVWVVGVGVRSWMSRRPGVPLVKDFDEFPSAIDTFSRVRRAYLSWMEKRMIAQADGFTCASETIAAQIRKRRPGIGTRLLKLKVAISADEHRVIPALAQKLRVPERPLFVYIGSIIRFYQDQLFTLIALAKELVKRRSPAVLRIVGGGADLDYFKEQVRREKVESVIEFFGSVPRAELASHMDAADVLLFPFPASAFNLSRCPTKAFNYAAADRPVVTNRTGEVAALFGDSAFYYPEGDIAGMASCCEEALRKRATFRNGIPFESLVWEDRAKEFSRWLEGLHWHPAPQWVEA